MENHTKTPPETAIEQNHSHFQGTSDQFLKILWALFFIFLPWLYTDSSWNSFMLRSSTSLALCGLHLACWPFLKKPSHIILGYSDALIPAFLALRWLSYILNPAYFQYSFDAIAFETCLGFAFILLRTCSLSESWFRTVCRLFIISAATAALLQWIGVPWIRPAFESRISAQFFHPNIFAILVSAAVLRICTESGEPKALFWLILGIGCCLLSGSKAALLALVAGCILIPSARKKSILWVAGVGVILFSILLYQSTSLEHYRNFNSFGTRTAIYKSVLNGIVDNASGTGPGMFAYKITPYLTEEFHRYFPNPDEHALYKAHNTPLELILESGWLMVPLMLCFALILIKFPPESQLAPLFILMLTSLFSIHLSYPTSMLFFILYLIPVKDDREKKTLHRSFFRLSPVFVVAGCMILFYGIQRFESDASFKILHDKATVHPEIQLTPTTLANTMNILSPVQVEAQYLTSMLFSTPDDLSLNRALEFQSKFPGFYLSEYYLASLYFERNDPRNALKWVEQSIDFHPFHAPNYKLMSEIQTVLGNNGAAILARDTAAALDAEYHHLSHHHE